MSYQERRIAVSLISALIVFALYAFAMFGLYEEGSFDGPEAGRLVGTSVFVLIGASIVVTIAVQIAFAIIHAVVTQENETPVTDERDRLIELKAMKVEFTAFSIGFVAAMGILALEMLAPYAVFLVIIASMFGATIVSYTTKLVLYRRGF